MENKRIRGARGIVYNGIKFRSGLECSCYKKLEQSELDFEYEPEKFIIWQGSKLGSLEVWAPKKLGVGKYAKELSLQKRALLNITYTPDFVVRKGEYIIYFDVKGKENDVYPIKKKMFLKYLLSLEDGHKYIFMEPHSVKQMLQAIQTIRNL